MQARLLRNSRQLCWVAQSVLLICCAPIAAYPEGLLLDIPGHCAFGTLPGRWVDAPPTPETQAMDWPPSGKRQVWRTFNRRCQLLPMIDSLVSRKSSHGGSPARILFIGESIDRIIKDDVCNWAAALGSPAHEIGFDTDQVTLRVPVVHGKAQNFSCDHCSGCMTNFATLGFMYVFGVAPVGPYHMGKQRGWPERVPEVIRSFKDLNEGEGPDLLVFAANFWDIAGYAVNNASKLAPDDLEEYVLEEFQGNLSAVLSAIDELVGHAAIKVFRTNGWVEPADCSGSGAQKDYLGKRSHIAQLNAASRHIAMAHGWEVVDLEPMIAKYGHTSRYLRDFIHPQTFLNVELFNIYLNLLRDHGRLQLGRDHHHLASHGQS